LDSHRNGRLLFAVLGFSERATLQHVYRTYCLGILMA